MKTQAIKPIVAVGEFTKDRTQNKANLGKFSKESKFANNKAVKPGIGVSQIVPNTPAVARPKASVTLTTKPVETPVVVTAPIAKVTTKASTPTKSTASTKVTTPPLAVSKTQLTPVTTPKKVTVQEAKLSPTLTKAKATVAAVTSGNRYAAAAKALAPKAPVKKTGSR